MDAVCRLFAGSQVSTSLDPTKIRSILFSQCGHLGDLIMTLPALHWVRRHRPDIRIGLIVGSWAKPMMGGISELYDHCYIADHFMLNRSKQAVSAKIAQHRTTWKRAAAAIRQDQYDVAIECYAFIQNSIPLLRAVNIPIRIGFTSGGFGPYLTHKATFKHGIKALYRLPSRSATRAVQRPIARSPP